LAGSLSCLWFGGQDERSHDRVYFEFQNVGPAVNEPRARLIQVVNRFFPFGQEFSLGSARAVELKFSIKNG